MFEENLVSHRFINIRVKRLQTWAQLFKARLSYRNFRTFTRMADYPQRSIFVIRGKKVQQITRTGLLPAPQNQRKSCYCIIGITTHKLGAMNIPCFCLQSRRSIAFSAKNWLLTLEPFLVCLVKTT